jgi:ectoine hydroxylase-related dioxygenase (phytanoyl-CoA dioxygenase family)
MPESSTGVKAMKVILPWLRDRTAQGREIVAKDPRPLDGPIQEGNAEGGYLNRFGGLWTDRRDGAILLDNMLAQDEISTIEHGLVAKFINEGFVILKGAVSDALISNFLASLDDVLAGKITRNMTYWDENGHHHERVSREHLCKREAKVLDFHWASEAAEALVFAPNVLRFLDIIFHEPALAFQSLYFHVGSQQSIHQDTAFVPVEGAPLEFVASWIALEDVQHGTGELLYVPKSHRILDLTFSAGKKTCPPDDPMLKNYGSIVQNAYESAGLCPEAFLPKKGDVLIWAADLAHGGAEITKENSTRCSMVTHYCPLSLRPPYALHRKAESRKTKWGGYVIAQG